MQAAATLATLPPDALRTRDADTPVLFVDGQPHPTAVPLSFSASAPLGIGSAIIQLTPTPLTLDDPAADPLVPRPLPFPPLHRAADAFLAQPYQLVDRSIRWLVLLAGPIDPDRQTQCTGDAHQHFAMQDRLGLLLEDPIEPAHTDALANARTLDAALAVISPALRLPITRVEARDIPLPTPPDPDHPLGDLLTNWFRLFGLTARLVRRFQGSRLNERLLIQPGGLMPEHAFDPATPGVTAIRRQTPPRSAVRITAQGPPRRIEATFQLHPAYDTALQSNPDTDYHPQTSTDWPRFAPVFRRWVLNEDAATPDTPVFDLAAFFTDPTLTPQPISFRDNLTVDTAGTPLDPQLELSYNSGTTWTRPAIAFTTDTQRAAVNLTEPQLPTALLTAARAGQLRVRLTASLTAPTPTRLSRFRGNAFLNPPDRAVLACPDLRFDTIDPSSIHADRVALGQLQARAQDDTPTLRQRLIQALHRPDPSTADPTPHARITLAGTNAAFTPGDRVRLDDQPYTLHRLDLDFTRSTTTLTTA